MPEEGIKLYPSNWLMAAGIVGFVKIFGDTDFYEVHDNELEILYFKKLEENFFSKYFEKSAQLKIPLKTFYNNSRLSNNRFKMEDQSDQPDIVKTRQYFFKDIRDTDFECFFCNQRKAIERKDDKDGNYKPVYLDEVHFTPLGSSPKNLANLYWEGKPNTFMCLPCELIIYCAAFGFIPFNGSYYFINAPATIKEIIEINDIWRKWLNSNQESNVIKNSFIEILKKIEKIKAKWSLHNISIIEINPISPNTSNIYNLSISPAIANAIRKRIESFPSGLKDIYDIFIDYLYSNKSLYELLGYVIYGFLNREKNLDRKKLKQSANGRLILEGRNLDKNDGCKIEDLLFFLKFQKEVEDYEQ
jgi:CRISPR-associated protein Cas8b1/Cst1 subtype I-B